MLTPKVINCLLNAEAKALATTGPQGLNVVPISTIKIENDKIILVDYFFDKTRENLKTNNDVSITGWTDLSGFQIKAKCSYQDSGELFEKTVDWIAKLHSERTVIGVVELSPIEVHDISIDDKV